MKKLFKLKLILLVILISSLQAYNHGGKYNGRNSTAVTPSVFSLVSGGQYSASSNIVNVATVRIGAITASSTAVSPGDIITVLVPVLNTASSNITLSTASLLIYNKAFSAIPTAASLDTYRIDNHPAINIVLNTPLVLLPTGTVVTLNFTVTFNADVSLFQQVMTTNAIIDAHVIGNFLTANDVRDTRYWWTTGNEYRYASEDQGHLDITGPPFVLSALVAPDPTNCKLSSVVTLNFSEAMDSSLSPSVFYLAEGVTYNINSGAWFDTDTWVGNFSPGLVLPPALLNGYEGIATIGILTATDNAGDILVPSYSVTTFEIDTLRPTASLVMNVTANLADLFYVTLNATDYLAATPSIAAVFSLTTFTTTTVPVNFISNIVGGSVWTGTVLIPNNVVVGSIATFNVVADYTDDAGNTNNVLIDRVTINIDAALPDIYDVVFDTVSAYNGINVSAVPFIAIYVEDLKVLTANAINAASIRVTVDGTLVLSGPLTYTRFNNNFYRIEFGYPGSLSQGVHTFEFGLSDIDGYPAVPFVVQVNAQDEDLGLSHNPVPFPNPFSPDGDDNNDYTYIVYPLTKSAEINIYIYDLDGNIVWRKTIAAGQEGGHAGVNRVRWDGNASYGREEILPNGLYICHVIAELDGEKRSLGRTKIFILK